MISGLRLQNTELLTGDVMLRPIETRNQTGLKWAPARVVVRLEVA
jgi:hypothetical protein